MSQFKMYDFTDLMARGEPAPTFYPENLTYNGHNLSQEIPGLYTIGSTGRDDFDREINAPDMVGDGALYLSSRIKKRKIVVSLFYDGVGDIQQFNNDIDRLKAILQVPNRKIKFNDDKYTYTGTPSMTIKSYGGTKADIDVTFELDDPFGHFYPNVINGNGTAAKIKDQEPNFFARKLTKILFVPDSDQPNFSITNGDQKLELVLGVQSGNHLMFDFNNLTVTGNISGNITGNVSLSSNFGDFAIAQNDTINFSTAGTYTIEYEVIKL